MNAVKYVMLAFGKLINILHALFLFSPHLYIDQADKKKKWQWMSYTVYIFTF